MFAAMHRLFRFLFLLLCLSLAARADVRTLPYGTNQAVFFSYAFSGDGRWIAGGTGSRPIVPDAKPLAGEVVLWDAAGSNQVAVLGDHGAAVNWMQFSRDGRVLASGSGSTATLRLWDVEGRRLRHTLRLEEPVLASSTLGSQMVCALSPDGSRLAAVGARIRPVGISRTSEAATLKVWDVASGKELWALTNCGIGAMTFTPDASLLVAYSRNVLWELVRGVHSSRIEGETLLGLSAADGRRRFAAAIPGMNPSHLIVPEAGGVVFALGGNRNVWYDLEGGKVTREQPFLLRQSLHVAALAPAADRLLAIDFSSERVHLVRITNGVSGVLREFKGRTNQLAFATISPDLKRIAGTRSGLPVVIDLDPPRP
jgi:hypothetical protein